jgi:hypothetical protein
LFGSHPCVRDIISLLGQNPSEISSPKGTTHIIRWLLFCGKLLEGLNNICRSYRWQIGFQ